MDMDSREQLLLLSAAELYALGLEVEAARDKLRQLVADGVPYDSQAMRDAYESFVQRNTRWKALEAQHLALRDGK